MKSILFTVEFTLSATWLPAVANHLRWVSPTGGSETDCIRLTLEDQGFGRSILGIAEGTKKNAFGIWWKILEFGAGSRSIISITWANVQLNHAQSAPVRPQGSRAHDGGNTRASSSDSEFPGSERRHSRNHMLITLDKE